MVSLLGILNVILANVLNKNLENSIIKEMNYIGNIENVNIRNHILINSEKDSQDIFTVINKISRDFKTYIAFKDTKDKLEYTTGNMIDIKEVNKVINDSKNTKSILNLSYEEDILLATCSYPVYVQDTLKGVAVTQKEFNNMYIYNKKLMSKIIFSEIGIFIIFIILLYILLYKTTKPLTNLSNAMKQVEKGNYDTKILSKSNDEIGELSNNFNMMKEEIQNKIEIISKEKEKIENLQKTTTEFFNNATHEMKTPIAAISGYAQLLEEDSRIDTFENRALNRVILESDRMHKLVCNLIQVAKGKAIKSKAKTEFNFKKLLGEVIEESKVKIDKQNMKLNINLPKLNVYAVEEEIKEVITNLIDNSIKYSKGKEIDIEGYSKEKFSIIEISNKCSDIPKNIKTRLFDPFIKHTYGDIKVSSSGLGLYICKQIVEKNEGYISYKIKKGKITFILELIRVERLEEGK